MLSLSCPAGGSSGVSHNCRCSRSQVATIKKNLRLFNGFAFDGDSEEYTRKRERLLRLGCRSGGGGGGGV